MRIPLRLLPFVVLALVLTRPVGAAPAAAAGEESPLDARSARNAAPARAPLPTALAAATRLRQEIPELAVSFDERSGAVRGLASRVGYLSGPRVGEPLQIGLEFALANLDLFGLDEADVASHEVTDSVYSAVTGATHIYLGQTLGGIPVLNAQLHFNVNRDARLISVNNAFVGRLRAAVNSRTPAIDPVTAVMNAARVTGLVADAVPVIRQAGRGVRAETTLDARGLSMDPIVARLTWLPVAPGAVRLVWRFGVATADRLHVYDFTVDAADGSVWTRFDQVRNDSYRVYAPPVESPNHTAPTPPADGRTTVIDPADSTASAFGWHDTDGVAGPEYLNMRGNNVHAYDDINNDNQPPATEPSCGAAVACTFAVDLAQPPSSYVPAAVANLFYWNNYIHDVQYAYGFDEAAGNFQVNNYGHGGSGNDAVRAEAQDGSGVNNANFATFVDGIAPRMQMYLWTSPTPDRAGDLDNGVIVHEYGHGISNRLVGGPATVSCLENRQQPGEGLSDWWALVYTAKVGESGPDPRGIGTYVLNQPTTGLGIRTQRYSTDPTVNTWTYQSISGMAVPHGVGSVWGQAAWEVYWALVDAHGFSANLGDPFGGAGNQRAMLYVNEGLKNTACSPTFTDVRDGIVSAAADNYAGEDVCLIWKAFAAFGLGTDAVSGGSSSTSPTNGFAMPASCCAPAPTGLTVTPVGLNRLDLAWSASPGATSYTIKRGLGACPGTASATIATGVSGTSYSDSPLGPGTYAYQVIAVDQEHGCESPASDCRSGVATGSVLDTLDQLYDAGGPGLGRKITADSGAVLIEATAGLGLQLNGGTSTAAGLDAVGGPVNIEAAGGLAAELELRSGSGSAARSWLLRNRVVSSTSRLFEVYDQAAGVSPMRLYAGGGGTLILKNGRVGIGTADPLGLLDVNGPIYQRGLKLHADDLFTPGRAIASIDAHAAAMWTLKHLPAVPGATVDAAGDDVVEDGAHRRGMLEELEVAHIYVDQLEGRIARASARAKLASADGAEISKLLAKLEARADDGREQPRVVRVATTLDQAYDSGGKGAGREIVASAGPVALSGSGALLTVAPSAGGVALEVAGSSLRVQRTDSAAASLLLAASGGTGVAQQWLVKYQASSGYLAIRDDLVSKKDVVKVFTGGTNNTLVVRDNRVGIGTESPLGTLDVNGAIYQRGKSLHADDLFENPGAVPSIAGHSSQMWLARHLPAVPAREVDEDGLEMIAIGAHRRGMLAELETAHIYIAELDQHARRAESLVAEAEARLGGQRLRVGRLLARTPLAGGSPVPVVRVGTLGEAYQNGRTIDVNAGSVEINGSSSPLLRVERSDVGAAVEVTGGSLNVRRTDGVASDLRLRSTGGAVAQSWVVEAHAGVKFLTIRDETGNKNTVRIFSAGAVENTLVLRGGKVGIQTLNPLGTLDVNGEIRQRGIRLHADYVFDAAYERASIDDHACQMWARRHLPAVPAAERDGDGQDVLELGAHRRGMLEELELAHIYIEELDAGARAAIDASQRLAREADLRDRRLRALERGLGIASDPI